MHFSREDVDKRQVSPRLIPDFLACLGKTDQTMENKIGSRVCLVKPCANLQVCMEQIMENTVNVNNIQAV
jgi:hypothetical protein